MEGVVNVEWHGQDYLHLKWHVLYSGLATPALAAGSELPRSCRNHTLLHMQLYCHRFAHSRLQLYSFLMFLIQCSALPFCKIPMLRAYPYFYGIPN